MFNFGFKNLRIGKTADVKTSSRQAGFTIMEIVVSTALFALVTVAVTSLFSYTLKINRRAEAIRQATQGVRDFVELLAKEVRSGQIDYGVINGQTVESGPIGPCPKPNFYNSGSLSINWGDSLAGKQNISSSYGAQDNKIGILDSDGNRSCFYLGDSGGNYVGSGVTAGQTLVLQKNNGSGQTINPPNFSINYLSFFIRPICDPYVTTCLDYANKAPKIQPAVTIVLKITATLPTGEQVPLFYQTTVSTDKYDVPNSP